MKASKWAILAVIAAIAAVVVAKEQFRGRRPAASPSVAAEVTAEPGPVTPGAPEQPRAGTEKASALSRPPREGAAPAPVADSPVGQGASAQAQPSPPPPANPPPRSGTTTAKTTATSGLTSKGPLEGPKLAECLRSGKPTVADFGKGWCIPCKQMVPVLDAAARKYGGKANVVYVDMEAYPEIAEQHRISFMPTQIFFDAAGQEIERHVGFLSSTDLDAKLSALGVR